MKGWLYSVLGQLGIPANHDRIIFVFSGILIAGGVTLATWVFM